LQQKKINLDDQRNQRFYFYYMKNWFWSIMGNPNFLYINP